MKNELDNKLILRVFEKIREHGEKTEDKYLLEGIYATTDFDGYTLYINDANVTLQFGFHNQYHFQYSNEEQRHQFELKLKRIDENY
ncbi:DUF3081 domain-containing protein [Alteromonas sp. a30]|uniref:DUF3081 domain-containing protein n=1 Tax=Alteromonas sp. a30 TaxID=2730917 RepID=UPI00227FED2C|nr:DUF3081 domain-containing protein [Alteromonas sp. a30]MCY7295565.1 DUF3081 domain-containing protein [Alteromonas sp. a30]